MANFTYVSHKKYSSKLRPRTLQEQLDSKYEQLKKEKYAEKVAQLVKRHISTAYDEILCLGLGSLSDSIKSQDQYVLLRAFSHPIVLYDPVFTEEDASQFERDGYRILTEEPDLVITKPTLLYMPHCPRSLFERLLVLNKDNLSNLLILGNRLDVFSDRTLNSSSSIDESPVVNSLASSFETVLLPVYNTHPDVFNDLAIQILRA